MKQLYYALLLCVLGTAATHSMNYSRNIFGWNEQGQEEQIILDLDDAGVPEEVESSIPQLREMNDQEDSVCDCVQGWYMDCVAVMCVPLLNTVTRHVSSLQ